MAKISKTQMSKLFHRLATGYRAGIDILTLIKRETVQGSPAHKLKTHEMHELIGNGSTLAGAMREVNGYFPPMAVAVVEAGERGGRLEDSFARLSEHYGNLVKFRNRFLQSIAWPLFEIGFAIVILGLLILVMGWIIEGNGGKAIDWFGMGLSVEGNFMLYCGVVLTVLTFVTFFVVGILKGWFGLLPMRIARRLPLIGPTIEALALSRFAWTLSVTQNAGMNPVDMAALGLRSTENYFYTQLEPEICEGIQDGRTFFEVMRETESFPGDLLMHVDNGELTGKLAESMDRACEEMTEKAQMNLKLIGTIGFVLMLMFTGLLIGGAVVYLYYTLVIAPINNTLQEFGY
ncbi:MAG: type II secretion system F family protein [Planctomycetota bacterium]